ncbi:MAG TPA: hypothetical protein VGB38_08150 [bacterium]
MNKRYALLLLLVCLFESRLESTTTLGGPGLIAVHSAHVLPKGTLELYAGTRYFGKIASFKNNQHAYTLWDVQGLMSLNYGISRHVSIGFSPILYQDINRDGGNVWQGKANLPDDITLSMKAGSFSRLESPFVFGGLFGLRLPTARKHNIIYEPYSAGRFEICLMALASYFSKPTMPDMGWSVHANLGYINHNDVGKSLSGKSDEPTAQSMSTELVVGDGILYPMEAFAFSLEINARYFLVRPPVSAYSREYIATLTGGVYYSPYRWLTLEAGMDIRLISGKDLTSYEFIPFPPTEDFPNYPRWRGILGLRWTLLPRSLYQSEEGFLKQKAKDRKVLLEKMMEQPSGTATAEQELSRIQAERKKVEEELERLRKLLEAEKKKDRTE